MKANELMIGDWVIVYEKAMPVKAKVEGVYGKMATVLGRQRIVEKSFVEPIPLTPEILEKNEFSRNGLDIALFDRKGGDDFVGASNLQYVHELQHVFRLCGIEKEIEL